MLERLRVALRLDVRVRDEDFNCDIVPDIEGVLEAVVLPVTDRDGEEETVTELDKERVIAWDTVRDMEGVPLEERDSVCVFEDVDDVDGVDELDIVIVWLAVRDSDGLADWVRVMLDVCEALPVAESVKVTLEL